MLGRGRWAGAIFVVVELLLVGVIGLGLDFDLSAGSTVSGAAFIVGLVIVAGVVVANGVVAAVTWLILAALAKRVGGDLALAAVAPGGALAPGGAERARVRAATWLLVAAAAHVVVKGVSGAAHVPQPGSGIDGVREVELKVGDRLLEDHVQALPVGSVVFIERIDLSIVRP